MDDRHVPMHDETFAGDAPVALLPAALPRPSRVPTCEGIRSTGARFRALATLLGRRGVSQCATARLLVAELAARGVAYHPRTIRRQITGAVGSVPSGVEQAMDRVAARRLTAGEPRLLDELLGREGLAIPPRELVVAHVPASTIKKLADLWLHENRGASRRRLALAIIGGWRGPGRAPDANALQRLLAGRATRGRAEVEAALLELLAAGGIATRDEALERADAERAEIRRSQIARGLEDSRVLLDLAWQWRLAHRQPSTRQLAAILQARLALRGAPPSTEHLQRALDGRVPRIRRVLREELEALLSEEGGAVETPQRSRTSAPVPEDLAWVKSETISEIARAWVDAHPGTTMRQLAIRVARAAARMGYAKPHHAIQPILAGHKRKTRGFVLRALLKATGRPRRIDPAELAPGSLRLPRPAERRRSEPAPAGSGVLINTLRRYPLLDRQTERELLLRYHHDRDPEAARQLVEGNLRFVAKLAHRYQSPGIDVNDLFAEGCAGLVEALDHYRPDRNVRFLTYAAHWIKKSIFEHLLAGSRVVPFRRGHAEASMFFAFRREQAQLHRGEAPDADGDTRALAARFETSEERVRSFKAWLSRGDVALDAARSPYDERAAGGFLAATLPSPEDVTSSHERIEMVRRACRELDPRARLIVSRRLLVEPEERASFDELSRILGVSRERVRQLQERAVEELRRRLAPAAQLSA